MMGYGMVFIVIFVVRFFFKLRVWRPEFIIFMCLVFFYGFKVMGVYMKVSGEWLVVIGLVDALVIRLLQLSILLVALAGFLLLVLCTSTRGIKTFSWGRLLQRSWYTRISQSRPQCHHFPSLFWPDLPGNLPHHPQNP